MSMTYDEQLSYYGNLLAMQYRGKPRAVATIRALADAVAATNLRQKIRDGFNVDPDLGPVAVGKQLDTVGKIVGVVREVLTFSGGITLSDAEFLTLIRLAIVKNNSTSSLKDIDDLLLRFLGNALVGYDNQNMTMGYFFNSSFGSRALASAFVKLGMLPRPTGVQISSLVYGGGIGSAYGWARYATPGLTGSGLNRYALGTVATGPWLRYTNTVSI